LDAAALGNGHEGRYVFALLISCLLFPLYAAIYVVQDYQAERSVGFLKRFHDHGQWDTSFAPLEVGVYFKKRGPWLYVLTDCDTVRDTGTLRRVDTEGVLDPHFRPFSVRLLYGFFASEGGIILREENEHHWIVLDSEGQEIERWPEWATHVLEVGQGFMVWRRPEWRPRLFFCEAGISADWIQPRQDCPQCLLAIDVQEQILALFTDFDETLAAGTLEILSWDGAKATGWCTQAQACAPVTLKNQHLAWFEWMDSENFVARPHLFRKGTGEILTMEGLAIAPHLVLTERVLGCVTLAESSHFSGCLRLFDLEFRALTNFEGISGVTPFFELDMAP
jgi:hypothetical protein